MHIIGLTGGIASGKSTVASELAALGAVVLSADTAAHQAINLPQVKSVLVERWGEGILDATGDVDRQKVAGRVFSANDEGMVELKFLQDMLHPLLREQFEARLETLQGQGIPVVVIDAPLLIEAGWKNLCDSVLFVESPEDVRLGRARGRGWAEQDFLRRESAQMPIEEKRRLSTRVIVNDGSLEDLRKQVLATYQEMIEANSR